MGLAAARCQQTAIGREGQIAQTLYTSVAPVHRALQDARFLPIPEEVVGRRLVPPGDAAKAEALVAYWSGKWAGGGGAAPVAEPR